MAKFNFITFLLFNYYRNHTYSIYKLKLHELKIVPNIINT